ncbi:NAD(P)H-binding protein [Streptomyces sp. B1866]|uniref:NAD(P)H-binding protein n=1 Tax=Streptomyces sp. B1866 TaxID=3075431 RepID=UPI00288FE593|nr:NAD(P)H-binding protein [Streptomyces sp. B1866]MDT3396584.1 NAD(P)H-binding protein [Streptomyces sp. B1866]
MIVVTGATGNVGRHLVRELAEAGAEVCALTRDPQRARVPDGVRVARADQAPLAAATAVFVHLAALSGDALTAFLADAVRQGVRRAVTLSSSSVLDALDGRTNPIAARHAELEQAVEKSGLEWTHVRPGAFDTNALQWAGQIRATGVVRGAYARAAFAPVHEADIAAVAARALLGDELVGATPELTGPEPLTFADQARVIGEAVGRPVRYEEVPPEEARKAMVGGFLTEDIADSLLRIYAKLVDSPAAVSPEVERITGRPARTFAQWAQENAAAFR